MAIDLKFSHQADPDLVAKEYESGAVEEAKSRGGTCKKVGPRRFEIHIDYVGQTVDLVTTISEGVVTVTGNASFLAEGTVVRRLKRDMPSLLRRCEELAAAGENNSSPKNQRA